MHPGFDWSMAILRSYYFVLETIIKWRLTILILVKLSSVFGSLLGTRSLTGKVQPKKKRNQKKLDGSLVVGWDFYYLSTTVDFFLRFFFLVISLENSC